MRRITVLVVAGAAGVAVGSILPPLGRTKVATPLGKRHPDIGRSLASGQSPRHSRARRQCGRARRAVMTSSGLGFEQFKAHDFSVLSASTIVIGPP